MGNKALNLNSLNPKTVLLWAIPALILVYVYYPTFIWMIDRWSARDSYYGHGFLIPLVTLYWLYGKKDVLVNPTDKFDFIGFALLGVGVALQVMSHFLRFYFLSGFSFIVILLGALYFMFGRKAFMHAWFPVAFLFLMVPMPLLVIAQVTIKMKFFVAEASTFLINSIGIPAIQQGSYIHTPNSILLVGDPCSGLRSLLAFICLGLVFAYDEKLAYWKRAVVALMGLPLAIISNISRVFFLGLVGEIYGMEHTGPGTPAHDGSGIAVFVIAFLVFMLVRRKLEMFNASAK